MIQTSLLDRSRLEALLIELSSAKFHSGEYNLAERLSYLIGVSGSIKLARSLNELPTSVEKNYKADGESLDDEVVKTCQEMILTITSSFVETEGNDDRDAQLTLPSSNGLRLEALRVYTPYQRCYIAHQTEMALGLQVLRERVRKNLAVTSIELHQLAKLDEILDEDLVVHTRRLFNVIPKLLEQRFHFLLQEHRQKQDKNRRDELDQWLLPDGWLTLFYNDMREMLLAEFDVRLQPILGLLEARNEQIEILS